MLFQTLSNELHPLLVQKTKNASYVLRYKNKWVDGVSKRISSETVGRILDESTGAFEFSEKFLNKNPQFRGLSFYWDKEHCILTYRNAPGLGPTTQSRLNAGAFYLFLEIAEQAGILEDLKTVWGEKAADIISLAIYFLVHPHLNIDSYFHTAERTLLPGQPLSAKGCTELFESITFDERNQYLKLRTARSSETNNPNYWAYDTTSISSYSETIPLVKYGFNKEHDPLPQIVLGILMDCNTGEPIDYQLLNGATADVSTLKKLFLDHSNIDVDTINLILDRGFDSFESLKLLYLRHTNFILAVKSNSTIIADTFKANWKTLKARNPLEYIPEYECFGRACKANYNFQSKELGQIDSEVYVHMFYSPDKAVSELHRDDLILHGCLEEITERERKKRINKKLGDPSTSLKAYFRRGEKGKWELKSEEWLSIQQNSGLFYLVSNSISSPRECLFKYRSRDVAEKGFNNFKERCAGRRARCQEPSLHAKIFVIYLAVSLRMMLRHRVNQTTEEEHLKTEKIRNIPDNSVPEMIDDLNYVGVTKCMRTSPVKYFWDQLTPKQRDYYKFARVPLPEGTFVLDSFISR